MLGNSIRLFTIRGIEVGVHYSWLLIFGLFTWILATSSFPDVLGRQAVVESWILAAITVLLMFVSVVIHELAHLRVFGHGPRFWALVAERRPDHRVWRRWLREHSVELHATFED